MNPIYASRRRSDIIIRILCVGAAAFGVTWLALILFTLFYNGLAGLSLQIFTQHTPPPGANVLPGMAVKVAIEDPAPATLAAGQHRVPASAVLSAATRLSPSAMRLWAAASSARSAVTLSSSRAKLSPSAAASLRVFPLTCCGTHLPRTCWRAAPMSGWCRNYSVTPR